jgi:hypothetical protein
MPRKRPDGVAIGANSTPTIGVGRRNEVICFRYKKEGHYATAYPTQTCFNCYKTGHKSYAYPELKKSENDSAPQ